MSEKDWDRSQKMSGTKERKWFSSRNDDSFIVLFKQKPAEQYVDLCCSTNKKAGLCPRRQIRRSELLCEYNWGMQNTLIQITTSVLFLISMEIFVPRLTSTT